MTSVRVNKIHSLTGHTDSVYALEPGGEPKKFFSAGGDGMVVQWDLENPEVGQLIARLSNSIYALHYLPGSDLLICGHNYKGIHVLDWKKKKEFRVMPLTTAAIFDIQSFDQILFVASGDGQVVVIDMNSWTILKRLAFSQKNARVLAIHQAAGELAVGYSDHAIRVFDLNDLSLKYEWFAHQNSIFALSYTPDGKSLISGSRDARLKSWDPLQKYRQTVEVAAHLYAINDIAFSPDAKHFVTCSLDKTIKVWEAAELRLLKVIDKTRHAGHGTSVNSLLWTSYNNQLLSASDDRTIGVWDIFLTGPDV